MKEGPVEVYHRARSTFIDALDDGIGKADAAAEYHFALLSMQRQGVVFPASAEDVHLQKMVDVIIKEEYEDAWRGEFHGILNPESAPVQPSPWEGRIQPDPENAHTRELADSIGPPSGSLVPNPMTQAYAGVSPFSRDIDPDMELTTNPAGGRPIPNHIERAMAHVLPHEPGGESKSEVHRRQETEDYNHYAQHDITATETMSELGLNNTVHDRFEQDFNRWKAGPGHDAHASLGPDDESQHELLKEFLRWKTDNDWAHGTFGAFGRLHGMYWESPEEVKDTWDHIAEHGYDRPSEQTTKHGLSMGRLKRSLMQHFNGPYEAYGRHPDMTGANAEAMPIPIGEPQFFSQKGLLNELLQFNPDILDFYLKETSTPGTNPKLREIIERGGRKSFVERGVPKWDIGGNEFIERTPDEANKQGLDATTLMVMAGIDHKTRDFYPQGQHPAYDTWLPEDEEYGPPRLDKDDVFQIMDMAGMAEGDAYEARVLQNSELMHTNRWIDPDHQPREITGGSNEGLSAHHSLHHSYRGGHGRHQNTYMRMLHDLWTHGVEDNRAQSIVAESDIPGEARTAAVLDTPQPTLAKPGYDELANRPLGLHVLAGKRYRAPFLDLREGGAWGPFSFGHASRELHEVRTGRVAVAESAKRDKHGRFLEGPKKKNVFRAIPGRRDHARNIWGAHVSPGVVGGSGGFERTQAGRNGPVINHHRKGLHRRFIGNIENWEALSAGLVQLTGGAGTGSFKTSTIRNPHIGTKYLGKGRLNQSAKQHIETMESMLGLHRHYMDPQERTVHHPNELEDKHFSTGSRAAWEELMEFGDGGGISEEMESELDSINDAIVDTTEDYHKALKDGGEAYAQQALSQLRELHTRLQEQEDLYESLESDEDKTYEERQSAHKGQGQKNRRMVDEELMPMWTKDNEAIMTEVSRMAQEALDAGMPLFQGDQRQTRQELMNFAKHANSYINRFPHDMHGHTSFGVKLHERPVRTPGGGGLHHTLKEHLHEDEPWLGVNTQENDIYERLGLDSESEHDQKTVRNLVKKVGDLSEEDPERKFSAQSVKQILTSHERYAGNHPEGIDWDAFDKMGEPSKKFAGSSAVGGRTKDIKAHSAHRDTNAVFSATRMPEAMENNGLHWVTREKEWKRQKGSRSGEQKKRELVNETLRRAGSVMLSDPSVKPELRSHHNQRVQEHVHNLPVGEAGTPHGNGIASIYDSPGLLIRGNKVNPQIHVTVDNKGKRSYHTTDQLREAGVGEEHLGPKRLTTLSKDFLTTVAPGVDFEFDRQHQILQEELPAHKHVDRFGRRHESGYKVAADGPVGLAALTNPDLLIKGDEESPPPLQPMHRIFDLDDLEELRGFTGDWVVTAMPEGHRIFLKREGDEVTATDINGDYDLPDEVKEAAKKTTGADFVFDVIITEKDEYKVFDLLEFDKKEVHDVSSQERIKILRGAIESVDPIEMPGAYNTRLTDDAGLETTVKSLQEENERILLRDAKSVYMKGEKRHPKWVLLAPGKDIVLMVLERRGSKPFTYRLGTGPITQTEKIGDRAVEVEDETYMDVGSVFDSDEEFEVGDHVKVNVDSISSFEQDDEKIFSIHAGSIEGEAEGEAITSRESMDLMKGAPAPWPHEIRRSDRHVTVRFPQGVILYKATLRDDKWSVHTPQADNGWLIRLAESQRPYWSPLVGLMLKGGYGMEDGEEKAEVHESEGEGEPLIPPKKVKGTGHWKKVVDQLKNLDKAMQGSPGHATSGAKGLGIDMATPIMSPTGPTKTRTESTLPDYDGRPRPEEEAEETDKDLKNRHRDRDSQIDMPVEADGEVGALHVDKESATLHM